MDDLISRQQAIDATHGRIFQEIVVKYPSYYTYPEHKGKPYFSIKYTENGQEFIGYGTYKPEMLSEYLKEYFIPSAQPGERTEKRMETHACDLISRQALCEYALNQKDKSVTPNDIMRFPSAQSEPHWIPLEEKMPDTNVDILLQFESNMTVGFYEDGDWAINTGDGIYSMIGDNEEKPIAWMPIPEAYKEGGERI